MKSRSLRRLAGRLRATPVRDSRMTLKDKVIALRLYWTFERDLEGSPIQGIHFYVQDGVVTMHGTFRHELDHELLLALITKMAGVKGVVDHLQKADAGQPESLSEITLHL